MISTTPAAAVQTASAAVAVGVYAFSSKRFEYIGSKSAARRRSEMGSTRPVAIRGSWVADWKRWDDMWAWVWAAGGSGGMICGRGRGLRAEAEGCYVGVGVGCR